MSPSVTFASKRRLYFLLSILAIMLFLWLVVRPQRRFTVTAQERQTILRADNGQQFDAQIAQLQERIRAEPQNPRWRQELAARYLGLHLWMDAAEVLEDAVQAHDTNHISIDALAEAYWNLDNRETAILWFKQNVRLHPKEVSAYLRLANAYTEMGDANWALEVLRHIPESEIKPEDLVPIAAAYRKAGDYAQAGALAARRLQNAPNDAEALWVTARSAADLGQWDRAASALEKANQLDARRVDFTYLLGVCRVRMTPDKAMEQAVPLWEKAVTLNPHLGEAYYDIAAVLEDTGHLPEAARAYAHAYDSPSQPVKVLSDLARVYKQMGQTSLAHKAMGLYLKHKGDADGAVREFEARLKLEPNNELAYTDLADAYEQAARFQAAVDVLKRALKIARHPENIYYNLARIYKDQQNVSAEVDALQQMVQSDPKEAAYGYRELCRIALEDEGEYDKAEAYIQKAIALAPNESDYHFLQGLVFSLRPTTGGRMDKAMDAFREALVLQPTNIEAAYQLGLLLMKAEKWEEAAENFRAAISFSPTYGNAYLKLYEVYRKQGKTARSATLMRLYQDYQHAMADRDMLQRRARANPNDPKAAAALGAFLMRNGQFSDAETEFQRMVRLMPRSPEPHQRLADLYALAGRPLDEQDELATAQKLRAHNTAPGPGG